MRFHTLSLFAILSGARSSTKEDSSHDVAPKGTSVPVKARQTPAKRSSRLADLGAELHANVLSLVDRTQIPPAERRHETPALAAGASQEFPRTERKPLLEGDVARFDRAERRKRMDDLLTETVRLAELVDKEQLLADEGRNL